MQPPRVFKSLPGLPAGRWAMAPSPGPRHPGLTPSRGLTVRLARRTQTGASRQSGQVLGSMYSHAKSALRLAQRWTRGGLNE